MEMRSQKKVNVSFIADEDVKYIIYPAAQPIIQRTEGTVGTPPRQGRGRPRRQEHIRKESEDSEEDLDSTLTEEIVIGHEHQDSRKSRLLYDDGDVVGEQLFGFRTRVRKAKLADKVKETINLRSPSTMSTPTNDVPKTPYGLRKKLKQQIAKQVAKNGVVNSSSESDYSPDETSESDSESEPEDISVNSSSDQEAADTKTPTRSKLHSQVKTPTSQKTPTYNKISVNKTDLTPVRRQPRRMNEQELVYVLNSDEYFARNSTKSHTSNHTLNRLKTPRLPPDQLVSLLTKAKPRHEAAIAGLFNQQRDLYPKWMFLLSEGYSIMTYGVGSKRSLLNTFHAEMLADWPVLVVNGFFPSLSIKEIVDSIVESVLELEEQPRKLLDAVDAIERAFRADRNLRMGLIVHNIDGSTLRSFKTQEILSRIAKIPNVYLITSVDHINGPAIWDQSKLSRFNFSWWDATTLLPYIDETSFESSLLVQRSGALALSSLSNVYRSLTANGQGIFKVIVGYQLEHKSGANKSQYAGMPFKELYRQCREAMLVSSDMILRTQLTEYLDHQLLVAKRSRGGSEVLLVPIDNSILDQFLTQLSEHDL